ncbi:CDP-glycerol--glycerophosphate glycerophosphotransferase [Halalkalibacillus sediminis]|uniref:CDP-glycerol--glycerophosphate glycerophosphotransferase n=1 Tax=Halalkalibacillus sediminis TaxID=2018042 RepID=A0A2I0QTW6_9BACI|nr:CDP-glycerol glycerophosphotransferase family protein [Halalkalibacillus sediminis]PKR77783.1 CDP-glycerol--glycerophosphate glycerophosphotransferase [Halalkalibacillus sediminis]
MNFLKKKIFNFLRSKRALKYFKLVFKTVGKLPKKKDLVVFESFHGKQYSDSPRAIYEYMREYNKEAILIWSVDRRSLKLFEELGLPHVRRFSIKWFLTMPRAKYWVNNVRLPNWLPKPNDTIYVQTWHGTPLKRLGIDIEEVHMPGTNTDKYKRNFTNESKNWNYLISPNRYSTEIFKRAFDYSGKVIESGYPRNDFLSNHTDQDIYEIKSNLGIFEDKKVILYAPTWRDDQFYSKGKYRFDIKLDLSLLQKELGNDYVVLLRMHYLIAENLDLADFEGFAFDVSKHLDIRELFVISDLLITDYSSVFFDFANLRRPILFYVYDLERYENTLRGFYFDFKNEAPGPLTMTTRETIDAIKGYEANGFELETHFEEFYKRFCYLEDGKATERVVQEFYQY